MLRTFGGYALGATALVACPCHLPLTLPLLMGVLGGTSVGAVLIANPQGIFVAATVYFIAALAGAWWVLGRGLEARPAVPGAAEPVGDTCCTRVRGVRAKPEVEQLVTSGREIVGRR